MNRYRFLVVAMTLILIVITVSDVNIAETSDEYASHVAILYDKELGLTEAEIRHFKIMKLLGVDGEVVEKQIITQDADSFRRDYTHVIVSDSVSNNLSVAETDSLLLAHSSGMYFILESKSELAIRMGIDITNETVSVEVAENTNHKSISIKYRKPVEISVVQTSSELTVLTYDKGSGIPIEAVLETDHGKVLYLAVSLAEEGLNIYDAYPFLHETLTQYLDMKPLVKRDGVIYYFDWGYHYFEVPGELAEKLHQSGVTEVHFSMWYELDKIDYFLSDFIENCHALGIKVIAWTEYPMVTEEFWEAHPEWREKTGHLEDAFLAWRKLVRPSRLWVGLQHQLWSRLITSR